MKIEPFTVPVHGTIVYPYWPFSVSSETNKLVRHLQTINNGP